MFRNAPRTASALAILLALAAAMPARAYPPGYERLVSPTTHSITHTGVALSNTFSSQLHSDNFGTEGFRPVDIELESFAEKINWQDEKPKVTHEICLVEVENTGPLQEVGWTINLEDNLKLIEYNLESQAARPLDIELYFRTETDKAGIFAGTLVVPRLAAIWVPNKGLHVSEWDFIPPMPEGAFYHELDVKYGQGWRPYDVDFAVDPDGHIFGTALLAPIVSTDPLSGTQWMATQWGWFTQTELDAELAADWELLDFEFPVKGAPDPLVSNPSQFDGEPVKFCVLVQPLNPVQFPETQTEMLGGNASFVHDTNADLVGQARLIDLETLPPVTSCTKSVGKDICESTGQQYEGAWLFPD